MMTLECQNAIYRSVILATTVSHVIKCLLCPGGGRSASDSSTKSTSSEEEMQDKQKEEGGFFSKLKKMFS